MGNSIVPILLLPEHLAPTPAHLPLLRSIESLLNESYSKGYGAYPELYSNAFLRIKKHDQIANIVGETGFMVILVAVAKDTRMYKVIATGSVKGFGEGDVEKYFKWSQSVGRTQPMTHDSEEEPKYEFGAFGVSPDYQSSGLGTRVLDEIEWLLSSGNFGARLRQIQNERTATVESLRLSDQEGLCTLEGIDLERLKAQEGTAQSVHTQEKGDKLPRLVLLCIKDVGSEPYYQRRGFKSIWEGPVPVGMWGNTKECTTVYMEKTV